MKTPSDKGFKYLDDEERELIESYEKGKLKPYPKKKQEEIKQQLMEAARNYRQKNARINIRISDSDLIMVRQKAAMQGIPYQTLIAGLVHQYAAGHIKSSYI